MCPPQRKLHSGVSASRSSKILTVALVVSINGSTIWNASSGREKILGYFQRRIAFVTPWWSICFESGVILVSANITDLASKMRLVRAELEEEKFQKMARIDGFIVEQRVLGVMLQIVQALPVSEETRSTAWQIIAGWTMSMVHATAGEVLYFMDINYVPLWMREVLQGIMDGLFTRLATILSP